MDLSLSILGCMIPARNHLAATNCTDFVENRKTNTGVITMLSPTHKEMYVISLRVNRSLFHPFLCSIWKTLCLFVLLNDFFPRYVHIAQLWQRSLSCKSKANQEDCLKLHAALLFCLLPLSSSVFVSLPCCPLQLTSCRLPEPIYLHCTCAQCWSLAQFLPKVLTLIPCIKAQICHV